MIDRHPRATLAIGGMALLAAIAGGLFWYLVLGLSDGDGRLLPQFAIARCAIVALASVLGSARAARVLLKRGAVGG